MVTPGKGDYQGIQMTPEARKIADSWDPAKDEASGEACRSYGAAALLQVPGRLHITWQDDNTLRLDTDSGTQTRLFRFAPPQGQGVPIESKFVSKQIENAQKRVEGQNFSYRKHVLEYDDVMNKQREAVYGLRKQLLEGEDQKAYLIGIADEIGKETARRRLVELVRRALLRDLPGLHDDDVVGNGERLLLIVRHVDHRKLERLLQVADLLPHAAAQFSFWSMMAFLGVLTVGFVYEWKKGALEWE